MSVCNIAPNVEVKSYVREHTRRLPATPLHIHYEKVTFWKDLIEMKIAQLDSSGRLMQVWIWMIPFAEVRKRFGGFFTLLSATRNQYHMPQFGMAPTAVRQDWSNTVVQE